MRSNMTSENIAVLSGSATELWWAFDNLRKAREAAENAVLPCWATDRLDQISRQNAFARAHEQVEVERAKVAAALQDVKDALAALEA